MPLPNNADVYKVVEHVMDRMDEEEVREIVRKHLFAFYSEPENVADFEQRLPEAEKYIANIVFHNDRYFKLSDLEDIIEEAR